MVKNFFITGSKGCGKTTLLMGIVESLNCSPSGFKTLPYIIEDEIKGHYFHSLVPVFGIENNLPFTIRNQKTSCIGVPEVFETLGSTCLRESLKAKSNLVVLDEIGIGESECPPFLEGLVNLLDSEKIIIAVLKKAPALHLSNFLARGDTFCVDLDRLAFEEAQHILKLKILEVLQ